jgi:hypothetical protein
MESMMKQWLISAFLLPWIAIGSLAWAHGVAEPRHGGMVQPAADRSFELVSTANGAAIYIDDHGEEIRPVGWGGKLTVLNGSVKVEVPLAVESDRLEAKGVKLKKGSKVVAVLTTHQKKVVTVRFTVR